jgi:glycolate oxidase
MHSNPQQGKVTPAIVDLLRHAIGDSCVHTDGETLDRCASDETEDLRFPPEVVVTPESTEMVSHVLRIAHQHALPVTPRGAGTGLSGGALAVHGGIVLSMERLNRILEIDTRNLMAVVEPGVVTQELQERVEADGLFYPPDPASRGSCFIGGNLAECSGGPRAVKYGVTKDYVLGVEAVLADGTIINNGGKLLKNVTGYNLTQLLIGSEGTLAVITKIILRLIPLPRHRLTLLIPFPDLESAAKAVPAIMNAGVIPSALELIEQAAIKTTETHLARSLPYSDAPAQILSEVDGHAEADVARAAEIVCEAAMAAGASDVLLADSAQKQQELWDMRRAIGEAVKSLSVYKEEDTVVPRNNIVPLLLGVKKIARAYGVTTICYGHAGDGNLHVNILKMDMTDERWNTSLDPVIREIFQLTVSLGGMISGEHGIGFSQKRYLPIALGSEEIRLMKRIKTAFDPKGVLNPGKIFPQDQ